MISSKAPYHLLFGLFMLILLYFIATLRQKKQDNGDYLASSPTYSIDDIAILPICQQAISTHPG